MSEENGHIYVFTGYGSGKTRAAFGTALRSIANNETILVIQFLKSPTSFNTGEVEVCRKYFPQMLIKQYGFDKITMESNIDDQDKSECQRAWKDMLELLSQNHYDLLILDEILPALNMKLITQKQFFEFLKNQPNKKMDIILTGRLHDKLLRNKIWEISGFYSDIYMKKHAFNKICSSCHIEYNYRDRYCSQCGSELNNYVVAKRGREF